MGVDEECGLVCASCMQDNKFAVISAMFTAVSRWDCVGRYDDTLPRLCCLQSGLYFTVLSSGNRTVFAILNNVIGKKTLNDIDTNEGLT